MTPTPKKAKKTPDATQDRENDDAEWTGILGEAEMQRFLTGSPLPLEWVPAKVPTRAFRTAKPPVPETRQGAKLREPDALQKGRHSKALSKVNPKVVPRSKIALRQLGLLSVALSDEELWEVFSASPDVPETPTEERRGTYLEAIVREVVARHGLRRREGEAETALQRLLMAIQQGAQEHHPESTVELRTPALASGRLSASRALGPHVGARRKPYRPREDADDE